MAEHAMHRSTSGQAHIRTIPLDPGLCRNITIHGYCKWADKGCRFNHGESSLRQENSLRLRPETPTFMPNGSASSVTPSTTQGNPITPSASIFVPRGPTSSPGRPSTKESNARPLSAYSSPIKTLQTPGSSLNRSQPHSHVFVPLDNGVNRSSTAGSASGYATPVLNPYDSGATENYYTTASNYLPLQHHLYSSLPPNRKTLQPNERSAHDFFLHDSLREQLQAKQAAAVQVLTASNLPQIVHKYHSLVPLDTKIDHAPGAFGFTSWLYKAQSKQDGRTYALRRIEGFKLAHESDIGRVEKWRRIKCANVVAVHEAFTTKAFQDDSIVFVQDYHPLAQTLYDVHYGRTSRKTAPTAVIAENLLWSYLIQMINAIRVIHGAQLACRTIDITKILVSEKNRLRISSCGVPDVISNPKDVKLVELQQSDFRSVGRIVHGLAMNNAPLKADTVIDLTPRGYSVELQDVVSSLLNPSTAGVELTSIASALAVHSMQNLDAALSYDDTLQQELAKETENGRLVRLLCKFGFINERPEFDQDSAWSETGERYVIKLFRDHVFHQVSDLGYPVLDLAHVLTCLNKLDAGTDERLLLVSRDETSCIVTSYKEMKHCVENAFQSLRQTTKNR